ncbi:hypothetical protein [Falsiroseomonas sp.]|uniref:hypothetical protein n=1 Tax=Falsiroseomonas sp. TaxID=2870721 RepID=UPI0035657D8C
MTRRLQLALPIALWLGAAAAQEARPAFITILPAEGSAPVHIAPAQVVRVARAEGQTIIDTAAWVQQRTVEPVDAVARRLEAAGQRLLPFTDLGGGRIWLAADRIVLVREAHDRHAAGAGAAIVMVGLRFGTDVAVRESVAEVMAMLGR